MSKEGDIKKLCSHKGSTKHGARKFENCSHTGCTNNALKGGICWKHGARKFCTREGCTDRIFKSGVCTKHGGRDVKTCDHEGCAHQARKGQDFCINHGGTTICLSEGCPNHAVMGGMCHSHSGKTNTVHMKGSRAKHGEHADEKPADVSRGVCTNNSITQDKMSREGGEVKKCSHFPCTNNALKGGTCWKHGARKFCTREGCANKSYRAGVCEEHGARDLKTCGFEGCGNLARNGQNFCIRHGGTRTTCLSAGCTNRAFLGGLCQSHTELDFVKRLKEKDNAWKICSHEGCTNDAQRGGFCGRHLASADEKKRHVAKEKELYGGMDLSGIPKQPLIRSKDSASGYLGVYDNNHGRWQASIKRDNKLTRLGRFDTVEEAAGIYARAAYYLEQKKEKDGCTNSINKGGIWGRSDKTGVHADEKPAAVPNGSITQDKMSKVGEGEKCSHEGCIRKVYSEGFCWQHGAKKAALTTNRGTNIAMSVLLEAAVQVASPLPLKPVPSSVGLKQAPSNKFPRAKRSAYGHPILSEKRSQYPSHPAQDPEGGEFPEGWVYRDIPRSNESILGKAFDRYWYSPMLKLQFRSKREVNCFLEYLEQANGDEAAAINMLNGKSVGTSSTIANTTTITTGKKKMAISVGDVGYTFRKKFDDGWYRGEVVAIRPGAEMGKDRRCRYTDGDTEDLSVRELQTLARLEERKFMKTKKKAKGDTKSKPTKKVQLLAFDPWAQHKSQSYDAITANYKTGEGFVCPRCASICSYDSRACANCSLECYYEAGVGVVVLKERAAGESDGARRSKRAIKMPRALVDEIYNNCEHAHVDKKARVSTTEKKANAMDIATPETKARLLSSLLLEHVEIDKAAESTLNTDRTHTVENAAARSPHFDEDEGKVWLETVAASLGADASTLQRKRPPRPVNRSGATSPLNGPLRTSKPSADSSVAVMKSDSTCSSITMKSDGALKQPPEAVLVSESTPASAGKMDSVLISATSSSADKVDSVPSLSLLSEYDEGSRHGLLVFHKNGSRRTVGEVIMETDSSRVEVSMDGELKIHRASHLFVVPSTQYKVGDVIPSNFGTVNNASAGEKPPQSPIELKPPPELYVNASSPSSCKGADSELLRTPLHNGESTTIAQGIAAIQSVMPSFLSGIQQAQINKTKWTINSIEDSVLCGQSTAFPLGLKVRKYFRGYGFHDGRINKVARKVHVGEQRPVLVYRLKYNDGDEEDFLHQEILSLRNIYDVCNISSEASAEKQIPPGAMFESRLGNIRIIRHEETPLGRVRDKEGKVIVQFDDSPKEVALDLLQFQLAIIRKITGEADTLSAASPSAILEWPGRGLGSTTGAKADCDICEGLTLHKKRSSACAKDDVSKFLATSTVNNPCDVRPGCNVGMWDPAACYNHLSWDPYALTICKICGVDENDYQIVICDECHKGFHTYCLRPVMVNIPKGDWLCSGCSGEVQISFQQYSESMCSRRSHHQEMFTYLDLAQYKNPQDFFNVHSEAVELFSLSSQGAIKQQAIRQQVRSSEVVFDVSNIKFARTREKNDWILPTPLLSPDDYASSTMSMVAAMKYCGMETYLTDHIYGENVSEEMNDPSLEIDKIASMCKRNLAIWQAYKHNLSRGVFPPVKITYDESVGFSAEAMASMPRHTIIGEYLGEVVTMEQSSHSNSDSLMVLLDTGDPKTSLIIDPTRAGNISRFLSGINNRSYESKRKANVRTRRFFVDGKVHVCLFTSRQVEAGEILNYDYNAGNMGKNVEQWARTGFYDTSNFF